MGGLPAGKVRKTEHAYDDWQLRVDALMMLLVGVMGGQKRMTVDELRKIKGIGLEAKRMLGRTPEGIIAVRPLKDGVIADFDVTEKMLRYFLKTIIDKHLFRVKPKVIVAMGGTAASAVFKRPVSVMRERGEAGKLEHGATGFITVHPSFLLRVPDAESKAREYDAFVKDLAAAWKLAA